MLGESTPKVKVSKATAKTRHHRPRSEWTPNDVAAEFRERVQQAVPDLVGYLPLAKNGVLVAATRKRLRTTPEVELALMEIFLVEDSHLKTITKQPQAAFRLWISTWPRNMNRALEMAGRPALGATEASESHESDGVGFVPDSPAGRPEVPVLIASDGVSEFPDTTLGRKRLARFEEFLKRHNQ